MSAVNEIYSRVNPIAVSNVAFLAVVCCVSAPALEYGYGSAPQSEASAECVVPTANDMQHVRALLDQPSGFNFGPTNSALSDSYRRFKQVEAKRAGVTLADPTLVDEMTRAGSVRPFGFYLHHAQDYLKPYGVKVSLALPGELNDGDKSVPTKKDLQTSAAKVALTEDVLGYAQLPIEYVRARGEQHLVVAKDIGKNVVAEALTGESAFGVDNTIVQNVTSPGNYKTIAHETGHLWDAVLCDSPDGALADPAFQALNPPGFEYGKSGDTAVPNYAGLARFRRGKLIIPDAYMSHPQPNPRTTERDYMADIVTADQYGLTNDVEDKADIAEAYADPVLFGNFTDKRTPILREKFLLTLGRLYHVAPNLATYFINVSAHEPEAR